MGRPDSEMHVSRTTGRSEAKIYVNERSGSLHEAFDTPSRYDDQRAQFVPKIDAR